MTKEETKYKPTQLNLYQKLAAITGEVGKIDKTGKSGGYGDSYTFIEYGMIAGRLRELFAKYGVVIVPYMQRASQQSRRTIINKNQKEGTHALIDFTFVVRNADKPEEKFSVSWTGEAMDYGDKVTNKAATAALKYYLMRQFNISEKGDDPDEVTPEPVTPTPAVQVEVKRPTVLDDLQRAVKFLKSRGVADKDACRSIIYGIAGVDSPKAMTRELMNRVLATLKTTSVAELQELYAAKPEDKPETTVEPVTDEDLAELDKEAREQRAIKEDVSVAVWTVPEFEKPSSPYLVPPGMTNELRRLIEVYGMDETQTATWMSGVISKPWPKTFDETAAALEAIVYELNEREQAKRTEGGDSEHQN